MTDYFPKTYGRRNPYFEALLKEGTNTSPIGAHSQGMSRLAFSLLAGLERGQMDREEREARQRMQPSPAIANPQAGVAGTSPSLGGSPDAPTALGVRPQQFAPERVPYVAPGTRASSDFESRWPPEGAFNPHPADWFSNIKRHAGWE
jgi:hypothetical protein